jgi:hypothetical protein
MTDELDFSGIMLAMDDSSYPDCQKMQLARPLDARSRLTINSRLRQAFLPSATTPRVVFSERYRAVGRMPAPGM